MLRAPAVLTLVLVLTACSSAPPPAATSEAAAPAAEAPAMTPPAGPAEAAAPAPPTEPPGARVVAVEPSKESVPYGRAKVEFTNPGTTPCRFESYKLSWGTSSKEIKLEDFTIPGGQTRERWLKVHPDDGDLPSALGGVGAHRGEDELRKMIQGGVAAGAC